MAAVLAIAPLRTSAQDAAPPAAPEAAAAPLKPPAVFKASGMFSGGTTTSGMVLSGVRFGGEDDYTRMVLDFEQESASGLLGEATAHPVYTIEYYEYPYRLVARMTGVRFSDDAAVQTKNALPFSVVTREDGTIKELQIFLAGPSEFKVIEVDDPAKLAIDVRPRDVAIPTVYAVQVAGPTSVSEAYALVEQGQFPAGFAPMVLVLGGEVVVEQAFTDPEQAAGYDAALREMGYACVINERRGDELPQA
jgi:hypothetical protein